MVRKIVLAMLLLLVVGMGLFLEPTAWGFAVAPDHWALGCFALSLLFLLGLMTSDSGAVSRSQDSSKENTEPSSDWQTKYHQLQAELSGAQTKIEQLRRESEAKSVTRGDVEVMNFVSMLQAKGRFLDFIMDDISKYADAQVGAAARVVHQGCARVMRDYFAIEPVAPENEGTTVTLDEGFDAHQFKLLGSPEGDPPFTGKVLHRGWQTKHVHLPEATSRAGVQQKILAPAEVEVR